MGLGKVVAAVSALAVGLSSLVLGMNVKAAPAGRTGDAGQRGHGAGDYRSGVRQSNHSSQL